VAQISETEIQRIVQDVLRSLGNEATRAAPAAAGPPVSPAAAPSTAPPVTGDHGVFERVDEAVAASEAAFHALGEVTLAQRGEIIRAIRRTCEANAEDFSRRTVEETGIGRVDHKIEKHLAAARLTPGIEDLEQKAWTGDHGLTVVEMAPWGVIGAVLPATHPVPTLTSNAIGMIAAGNSVYFGPHPASKAVSAHAVRLYNQAIVAAGGPRNLITTVQNPTIEAAQEMFKHPTVSLLVITGGPGVVKAAMSASKKAICAGPGNPPVVVDETADLKKAARDIFTGATFDNNIICISEKEVFCVESVFEELKRNLIDCGSYELSSYQIEQLAKLAFGVETATTCAGARLNRDMVGRDASVLAKMIGLTVDPGIELLIGETEFGNVFVQEEQMMPFLPLVRCPNVDQAIDMAKRAERNFRHTAIIHSKNVETMTKMAKVMDCSVFVKNGPSMAGDGLGGEGYMSFSIATPTGEGITSTRTFTRQRRCTLVDYFRIV
jgi:aldehyde dehydrogenase